MGKNTILHSLLMWNVDLTPSLPHWKNYPTALFLLKDFSENCRNIRNKEETKEQPESFFWTAFSYLLWSTPLLSRLPICNPGRKLLRMQGLELWLTAPAINIPSVQSLVAKSSISVTGFWALESCFQNWTHINFSYQKKDIVTTKSDNPALKKYEKKPSIFRFHSRIAYNLNDISVPLLITECRLHQ